MKAIVLHGTVDPTTLRPEDAPDPTPGPHEVVVRLRAAALNHRDLYICQGQYAGLRFPIIPGSDGVGEVAEVGAEVQGIESGQHVVINPSLDWGDDPQAQGPHWRILGLPDNGTFAQYVKVPANAVLPRPGGIDDEEAAAIPLAGLTAYRALVTRGGVQAGETVLVTGIGGGVATFVLLLARKLGARVLVTSGSAEKLQRARELGADDGFNYKTDEWVKAVRAATDGRGPDLIVDGTGGETFGQALDAARPGGRVVSYGATTGITPELAVRRIFWKQLTVLGSTMGTPADFAAMLEMFGPGGMRPVVDRVFPLDRGRRGPPAHERRRTVREDRAAHRLIVLGIAGLNALPCGGVERIGRAHMRGMGVGTVARSARAMPRNAQLLLLSMVLGSLPIGLLMVLFPLYLHDLGMRSFLIGGIFTLAGIGSSLLLIVIGPLADRLGRRPFLIAGTALPSLGFIIFATSTDPRWLVLASLLGGVGFSGGLGGGLVTATLNPMLSATVEPRLRTTVLAWGEGRWAFAMGIGSLLAGLPALLSHAGIAPTLSVDRALFLLCFAVTIAATVLLIPVRERPEEALHDVPQAPQGASWDARASLPTILKLAVFFALQGRRAGSGGATPPPPVRLQYHTTAAAIAPWFAVAQVAGLVTIPLVPSLARRLGTARVILLVARQARYCSWGCRSRRRWPWPGASTCCAPRSSRCSGRRSSRSCRARSRPASAARPPA